MAPELTRSSLPDIKMQVRRCSYIEVMRNTCIYVWTLIWTGATVTQVREMPRLENTRGPCICTWNSVTSTFRAPSNRREAVKDEMTCAISLQNTWCFLQPLQPRLVTHCLQRPKGLKLTLSEASTGMSVAICTANQ
jgi:hypothetical protein